MNKKTLISFILLLCTATAVLSSCNNAPPPPPQAEVEQPPPDYSVVDKGLKDSSVSVRTEATRALTNLNHKQSIPRLVLAIKDNEDYLAITGLAAGNLVNYKDDAIEPVKTSLWNSKDPKLQSIGFDILSQIEKPEDLVKETKEKFDKLPPTPENRNYRIKYVTFYLDKVDRKENIADIVLLLLDDDTYFADTVVSVIANWKDPEIEKQLNTLLSKKNINDNVKLAVLKTLYNYDIYSGEAPLHDITPFLLYFGNTNPDIHSYAYIGIKKFGYKDKDDQIIAFIKKFENCSDEKIRSNVIELQQFLPTVALPADPSVMPKFTIPSTTRRKDICI